MLPSYEIHTLRQRLAVLVHSVDVYQDALDERDFDPRVLRELSDAVDALHLADSCLEEAEEKAKETE